MDKKHIINIIIPATKDSERFPGKNSLLKVYTENYLALHAADIAEQGDLVTIYTLYREGGSPVRIQAPGCNCVSLQVPSLHADNMVSCMLWWYNNCHPGDEEINIQLMLTQPVRRPKLMHDAISVMAGDPKVRLVKTYSTWVHDNWRVLDENFNLPTDTQQGHTRTMPATMLYDGALYAWRGIPDWIGENAYPGTVYIPNYTGPVVDIDYPEQFNRDYIEGVRRLASHNPGWYGSQLSTSI